MRKLFLFVIALIVAANISADELYLVGDGTPIGWEGDSNQRQATRMTETTPGVYVWTGLLKHGGEGFKICDAGWDGYHPSAEAYAISGTGSDTFTTDNGADWKWNPTNEEWAYYTITLDKNAGTLSWEPAEFTPLTAVDGVISIGTAEELNKLAFMLRNNVNNESYNVKLTADIDYTAYKNGSMSVIGITEKYAPFRGDFDGQNHTVTVDLESYSTRVGLFGTIIGKVHNLKVAGKITATNKNQTGSFCGLLKGDGTKIYNCISTVEIIDAQSGDGTIGGFCAVTDNSSTLENCAFYGKINASSRDGNGGLVGWANSGASTTIKNCLVVADINWNGGDNFGRNNPSVINSYKVDASDATLASGEMTYTLNNLVSGAEDWFQTLGTDAMPTPLSSSAKLYANGTFYCDGVTSKGGDVVLSNTNASVVDPHVFGDDGICTGCHAAGQEPANADGVYQIANKGNLLWWAASVNKGNPESNAVLTANIDMTDVVYVPAGNSDYKYVGTFDGQGHSVTLKLENSGLNYQGLFGVATDGATIKNVVVKGSVSGNSYVAGIVGGSNEGEDGKKLSIINCGNEATITAANANGAGIIGVNMGGSAHFFISNCYNVGNVTSGRESGAITGWTGGDKTTIENTYNIGVVTNGEGDGFVRGGGNLVNTYTLAAGDAKVLSGELAFLLNGSKNGGTNFYQALSGTDYPVLDPAAGKIYGISEVGYSTAVFANDVVVPAANAVFTATVDGDAVKIAAVDADATVAAGTAVILGGAAKSFLSFKPSTAAPATLGTNVLKGSATEDYTVENEGDIYILTKNDADEAVFAPSQVGTLKAGKAYIEKASVKSGAPFLRIGGTTGIANTTVAPETNVCYDLMGRRVSQLQRGIYIVNGKKVVVK